MSENTPAAAAENLAASAEGWKARNIPEADPADLQTAQDGLRHDDLAIDDSDRTTQEVVSTSSKLREGNKRKEIIIIIIIVPPQLIGPAACRCLHASPHLHT